MPFTKKRIAFGGRTTGYLEWLPDVYDAAKKYPLIIFLHGIGERGDGSDAALDYLQSMMPANLKKAIARNFMLDGAPTNFLLLAPQLPKSLGAWDTIPVSAMFEAAKALGVDSDRVYLTGLSLGGGGVWNFPLSSFENAGRLAAIAPVCPTQMSGNVCNVSASKAGVWNFHAKDDGVVGVGNSQWYEQKLRECGAPAVPPTFTYFTSGGHNIWERVYDADSRELVPNIYDWLLRNKKAQGTVPPPPVVVDPNVVKVEAGDDIVCPPGTYGFSVRQPDGKYKPKNGANISGGVASFWVEKADSLDAWIEGNPYAGDWNFSFGNLKDGQDYTFAIVAQNASGVKTKDLVRLFCRKDGTPPPGVEYSRPARLQYDEGGFVKIDTKAVAVYEDSEFQKLKHYRLAGGGIVDPAVVWTEVV
jgi:predicted esterase